MKRVVVVFGTRPEAIKMIPVVKELRKHAQFQTIVVTTGQHRQMLDQVFETFSERPDIDLNMMTPGQSLTDVTARALIGVGGVIDAQAPDLVLVHGDTTTAMAAALAAFYRRCPIGHVEAGLRSFDLQRPWPEEFNRVAIDSIAAYAFAPTPAAKANLEAEYNRRAKIYTTGNTGIDALLYVSRMIDNGGPICDALGSRFAFLDPAKRLVLITGHRRESFGDGFERICDGLSMLAARGDVELLYPVHFNPQVKTVVRERLKNQPAIHLVDPVDYLDMVYLMKRSTLIITDSGGVQEEAPALGKPVLVMRDVTERPEAMATGVAQLIGTDPARMRACAGELLDSADVYRRVAQPVFPYGNGTAAQQIVEILKLEMLP